MIKSSAGGWGVGHVTRGRFTGSQTVQLITRTSHEPTTAHNPFSRADAWHQRFSEERVRFQELRWIFCRSGYIQNNRTHITHTRQRDRRPAPRPHS